MRRQTVNATLALQSSSHGYFCTLDLSAASDRLSLLLVERVLPPEWFARLANVRSERTKLPDGSSLTLRKFGSMGNATTFPVQSLVYWGLIVAHLRSLGIAMDEARSVVFAYGDDIICPSQYARSVMELLTSVGLKVNEGKSFSDGSFRESCGTHAYRGTLVTPAYLRTTSTSGPGLVSMCSCANSLYESGYVRAAASIFAKIENALGSRLPVVGHGGSDALTQRKTQLCRVRPEVWNLAELISLNESSGIPVKVDGCQRYSVKAYGLYESISKRRSNVFACTGDMWDFTHSLGSDEDRGYIPGTVKLSQRYVTLL